MVVKIVVQAKDHISILRIALFCLFDEICFASIDFVDLHSSILRPLSCTSRCRNNHNHATSQHNVCLLSLSSYSSFASKICKLHFDFNNQVFTFNSFIFSFSVSVPCYQNWHLESISQTSFHQIYNFKPKQCY
jgi:hypothetical protein